MAKELNVPIVGTLNAKRTTDPNPPSLSRFHSSYIENADVILLLPQQRIRDEIPSPHIETLKIEKNCFGKTGKIKILFFLDTVCFDNLD